MTYSFPVNSWLKVPFLLTHIYTNIYSRNAWKNQSWHYQAHFHSSPLQWNDLKAATPFAAETWLPPFFCVYFKPRIWRARCWENSLESNQGLINLLPWLIWLQEALMWDLGSGEGKLKAVGGAAFSALTLKYISLCIKHTELLPSWVCVYVVKEERGSFTCTPRGPDRPKHALSVRGGASKHSERTGRCERQDWVLGFRPSPLPSGCSCRLLPAQTWPCYRFFLWLPRRRENTALAIRAWRSEQSLTAVNDPST